MLKKKTKTLSKTIEKRLNGFVPNESNQPKDIGNYKMFLKNSEITV